MNRRPRDRTVVNYVMWAFNSKPDTAMSPLEVLARVTNIDHIEASIGVWPPLQRIGTDTIRTTIKRLVAKKMIKRWRRGLYCLHDKTPTYPVHAMSRMQLSERVTDLERRVAELEQRSD